MAVFYQIYRPKNFSEMVGQEALVKALQNAADSGTLGHAYLFTGGRGLGKTSVARILAKAANCDKLKNGDPCGVCETCMAIASGSFLDVIEIDAASHTGVDNIRELIEHIQFQPSYGKTKVFIIDEVHMLSKAAFNALLKTLEEPPAHAMFILATTDSHKLPETIVSRTQRFDFRSHTPADVAAALERIIKAEKLKLPKGSIEVIVENAEGGLRDALSQLGTVALLPSTASLEDVHMLLGTTPKAVIEALLQLIVTGDQAALPTFFTEQSQTNFDASAFGRKALGVLQQMLESTLVGAPDELAEKFTLPQLLHTIRLFLRAYKEVDRSVAPDLPLLLASIEASMQFTASSTVQEKIKAPATDSIKQTSPQPSISSITEFSTPAVEPSAAEPVAPTLASAPEPQLATNEEATDFTRSEVEAFWPKIIEQVKTVNSPIATLLKNSPLHDVVGNTVIIAVKYLFHKENLENAKNKTMVTDIAAKIAGSPVGFKVIIQKKEAPQHIDTATVLTDAIKIFGGELVE